ncbi:MAG: PepSY-like domain-containing protein [Chitinophagaceae bacterium]|nr:PepSY-like domain-containing protein [Chitinophagaceae bacterium]
MKLFRLFVIFFSFSISSVQGNAQVTSIPEQAKENFFRQYPDAKNVQWENNVVNVKVRFEQDSNKLNAEYSNKGIWKNTLKDWTYEQLPEDVKEGLKKSKYADREVTDVKVLYLPGYVIQYRLRTEKNNVEKKYLFFNTAGRLIRTSVTL